MGYRDLEIIVGAKGGGLFGGGESAPQQRTPVEDPDSARSQQLARVLDLISEGEVEGPVDVANPLKCVYLNDTPIQNPDGSYNFQGVTLQTRNGTQSQSYINGFPAIETEIDVGLLVGSAAPVVKTVVNADVTAARITLSFPQLTNSDVNTGDIHGTSVSYAIDLQNNGGGYVMELQATVSAKVTTPYQRSHRIQLTGNGPWDIRVRKLTADSTRATMVNNMVWSSYTEIIDGKFRYPNSALVALQFDAKQLSSVPRRAYDWKLLRIKVPANYDPITRVYSGAWDGTFKIAWSDNPAWVYYDMATTPRYGLGEFNPEQLNDKWALYAIGQYCDETVNDGFGGNEPRMTCNIYLQTAEEAYTLLQNLASIFRGMMYWTGVHLTTVSDHPGDPIYQFNQANVVHGNFTYQGSSQKARHTVTLVAWNDPADFGRQKIEYVEDQAGVARYGVVSTPITAFGCTSRGQAHRLGLWMLYTERLETETVSFQCALDGVSVYPGALIEIHDPSRAGTRAGGRIVSATTTSVVIDAGTIIGDDAGALLTCVLPDGTLETRSITPTTGTTLVPTAPFSQAPLPTAIWIVSSVNLVPTKWRVVAVVEDAANLYSVTALSHDENKYAAVDTGVILQGPPTVYFPPREQLAPPTDITWTEITVATAKGIEQRLDVSWTAPTDAAQTVAGYILEWQFQYGIVYRTTQINGTLYELPSSPGSYVGRVYAVGKRGGISPAASSTYTVRDKAPIGQPVISGLELFGQDNDTIFDGPDAIFAWRYNAVVTSYDLGSEPQGASSGSMDPIFLDFEIRIYDVTSGAVVRVEHTTDPHWTYTLVENAHDGHGAPRRTFTIGVAMRDRYARVSSEARLTVSNPMPLAPSDVLIHDGFGMLNGSYTAFGGQDYVGVVIYISVNSGFTPDVSNEGWRGSDTDFVISGLAPQQPYFLRFASEDVFGVGAPGAAEYTGTPASSTQTASDLMAGMNEILSGTNAQDKLIFSTTAFAIQDPNDVTHFPLGVVDMGGGAFAVGINADVVINGDVSIANLTTGALASDVQMTLGGTIIIDGNGAISVYKGPGANQDYVLLTAGDIMFRKYIAALSSYVTYNHLRRMEFGTAASGSTVAIPGYWEQQPLITVNPAAMPVYKSGTMSAQDQSVVFGSTNVRQITGVANRWQFDVVAVLQLTANTGSQTMGASSGDTSSNAFDVATFTTPGNCLRITPNLRARSKRGNGSGQYFHRMYRWTLYWKTAGGPTWTGSQVSAWIDLSEVLDAFTAAGAVVNFPSAGTWDCRLGIETADKDGTLFGAVEYQYSNQTLTDSQARTIATVSVSGVNQNTVNAGGGGFPANPFDGSWEIYQIVYNYTYDLIVTSNFTDANGRYEGNMSASLSARNVLRDQIVYQTNSATFLPSKIGVGASYTYQGSFLAHSATPWSATVFAQSLRQVGAASATTSIRANATATLYVRKPASTSTTPVNTGVIDSYAFDLSGASVPLLTGSANWTAIGR